MSSNPYENEPGYENANAGEDKKNQAHYVAKVNDFLLHLSGMLGSVTDLSPFLDGFKRECGKPPSLIHVNPKFCFFVFPTSVYHLTCTRFDTKHYGSQLFNGLNNFFTLTPMALWTTFRRWSRRCLAQNTMKNHRSRLSNLLKTCASADFYGTTPLTCYQSSKL